MRGIPTKGPLASAGRAGRSLLHKAVDLHTEVMDGRTFNDVFPEYTATFVFMGCTGGRRDNRRSDVISRGFHCL